MIRRVFVTVLLFATANTVDLDSQKRDKVCDDGIHLIEKDLGDGPNWNCQGTNIIIETVSTVHWQTQRIFTHYSYHLFFFLVLYAIRIRILSRPIAGQ